MSLLNCAGSYQGECCTAFGVQLARRGLGIATRVTLFFSRWVRQCVGYFGVFVVSFWHKLSGHPLAEGRVESVVVVVLAIGIGSRQIDQHSDFARDPSVNNPLTRFPMRTW